MNLDILAGKKTSLSALALLIWAIAGMILGSLETTEAIQMIIGSLAIFGLGKKIERTATPIK